MRRLLENMFKSLILTTTILIIIYIMPSPLPDNEETSRQNFIDDLKLNSFIMFSIFTYLIFAIQEIKKRDENRDTTT